MNDWECSSQWVVVNARGYHTHQAVLCTFEHKNGQWYTIYPAMPAVIGKQGLAPPGEKREGDGRTPTGTYPLEFAFGYEPLIPSKMPYRQATENDYWVNDPYSSQYNQWVHGQPDASSYETMRRHDNLYQYGIVIGYNRKRVPGLGSAIFLHVWPSSLGHTAGCIAVSAKNMIRILRWLDPDKFPHISIAHLPDGPLITSL